MARERVPDEIAYRCGLAKFEERVIPAGSVIVADNGERMRTTEPIPYVMMESEVETPPAEVFTLDDVVRSVELLEATNCKGAERDAASWIARLWFERQHLRDQLKRTQKRCKRLLDELRSQKAGAAVVRELIEAGSKDDG